MKQFYVNNGAVTTPLYWAMPLHQFPRVSLDSLTSETNSSLISLNAKININTVIH